MDLKNYYRKIRGIEAAIEGECAVVVSRDTPDGGRAGVFVEAPRLVAARLVAEGAADLATADQAVAFRESLREAFEDEERRRTAARIQVSIISEADAQMLAGRRASPAAAPTAAPTAAKDAAQKPARPARERGPATGEQTKG